MQPLAMLVALGDLVAARWFGIKSLIEQSIVISHDALHVLVGVVLQLILALALRVPISRWSPWLVVLSLELANEWSDLRTDLWPASVRSVQIAEGVKDVLLTMALPTLLLLAARRFPAAFRGT